MWNLLPIKLRQTPQPSVFKKGLQKFLWNELSDTSNLSDSDFSENDINDSQDQDIVSANFFYYLKKNIFQIFLCK